MRISEHDLDEIIANLLHENSKRDICLEKRLIEIGIHLPLSKKLLDKHIRGCEKCKGIVEELWGKSDEIGRYKKGMWQLVKIVGAVFGAIVYLSWDPTKYWDNRVFDRQTKFGG